MPILYERMHRRNALGSYDTVHLETDSKVVKMSDGSTLESKFNANGIGALPITGGTLTGPLGMAGSAGIATRHIDGESVTFDGALYLNHITQAPIYCRGGDYINLDTGNIATYVTPSSIGAAQATHNHDASQIVSGILPIAVGGTGTNSVYGMHAVQFPTNNPAPGWLVGFGPNGFGDGCHVTMAQLAAALQPSLGSYVVGVYITDNTEPRTIYLGFQPSMVILAVHGGVGTHVGLITAYGMAGGLGSSAQGGVTSTGFVINTTTYFNVLHSSGSGYYVSYIAFK